MAGQFNGTASVLELGNAVSVTLPMTFACWFMQTLPSAGLKSLISITQDTSTNIDGWTLGVNASSSFPVFARTQHLASSGLATSLNNAGINFPVWQHGAATFISAVSRTAWLNGIPGAANTTNLTVTTPTRTDLGACYSAGALAQFWKGMIAEAAIWNVELSATEILALSAGVPPSKVRPGNLLLYLPMRAGFGDAAKNNFLSNTQVIARAATPKIISTSVRAIGAPAASLSGAVSESANAADAVSASRLSAASLAEAATAADTVSASAQFAATLGEAANAVDAILSVGNRSVSIAEAVSAADAVLTPGGSVFSVAVIESVAALDTWNGFPPVDVIGACDGGIEAIDVIGSCGGEADAYGDDLYGVGFYGGGTVTSPSVIGACDGSISRITIIGA